ncbi:DNA translocase FtsK [Helicobacter sp.]|nr:DNA translocase FtsK [Helicobacter sp.]MCI5967917.1 DNA translocase FtsK [Helicobacter sp.]MDY2584788.1 DNA translocase FtsK [Helicobacter sp.]
MASLENFKRFEKSDVYYKEEEQKEEAIKLIKKESISEQELEQTPIKQESFQKESPKKQAIKSYPKKLYAATPFSAYYDKESVGTHDCLVDTNSFQREYPSQKEKDVLPKTIFYYGDRVSTHPLTENTESKSIIPQIQVAMQESVAITENTIPKEQTSIEATQNMESKIANPKEIAQSLEDAESKTPQESTMQAQMPTQMLVEQTTMPQYATIPNAIPTFDYGYVHYQEPARQIPQPVAIEQIKQTMESKTPQQLKAQQASQIELKALEQTPPQALQTLQEQNTKLAQTQVEQIPIQAPQIQSVEIVKTLEENTALLENLEMAQTPQMLESKNYELPKLEFLQEPKRTHIEIDESEIDRKINDLLNKMRVFKIEGDIVRTYSGPIVTTFEFRPSPNVKVSRILTLQDDLAMALRAKTIRIQAPIPGKDVVGIEIPNAQVETIYLREILENDLFKNSLSSLTLALGKDIVGNPFVTDLKKLPHLLIAGTTGSGKSVGINAMILSLLYKNPPDKLKLIMVDPKMVEFSIYNDIPHLLTPVITNPKNAIFALDVAVKEMEQRNALISEARVKNIESYNQKAEMEGFEPFPYIVIIIDELADLMMTGGKEAEASISRLTQMARSSGIHLIVATQRPSVDVVTGLIKANLPSRISYKVGQKIDSKVILDCHGAESLLGNGDMLFAMGGGNVTRLHAPFSTEEEIERIVEFIKAQCPPQYDERFLQKEERTQMQSNGEADDLYEEAKRIMLADGKTSISYIQRRLGIGFNKAANIVEQMQQRGFLSKENSKGVREIIGDKN